MKEEIIQLISQNKDIRNALDLRNQNNIVIQKKAIIAYEELIKYILSKIE